ncbi:MAG: hypothetical protein WKF47_01585 [Geodermatophilaceae bacterium]
MTELSTAVARSRNAGIHRPLARDLGDPVQCGRAHQRNPQTTVGAEALLRREVVDIAVPDVDRQPAGAARGIDENQRTILDAGRPAGSGAMTPVEVSLCAQQ